VEVCDDNVLNPLWVDLDSFQPLSDRIRDLALSLLRHDLVEASVNDEGAVRADDRPDKVIEGLWDIVRIAADEILRRFAVMVTVTNGVDVVHVVGHGLTRTSSRVPRRLPSARRTERRW
jgi:hypothetical protein